MRRKDREVTDVSRMKEIVSRCKVCRLGLTDGKQAYIVPLNFGYDWDDALTLYFHSAKEGRKLDILKENPRVCFEMDIDGRLIESPTACNYGYAFASVMGEGEVEFIEDDGQKAYALTNLMLCQTGKEVPISAEMAKGVCVYKVRAESVSCKVRE